MATKLIHNFTTTASSPAADDYAALDGATNGTRKWSASHFQNLGTGDSPTFAAITSTSTVTDIKGDVRDVPQNTKSTSYSLLLTDSGKHIYTSSGVTIPSGVFSAGNAVIIVNNSGSNVTITQGTSTTVHLAGTALTGNRTLAQYGVASVLCVASNTFIIMGSGVT